MLLIIDGNALGHAFHRATTLTVRNIQVQAIFGMLRTMRNMKVAHPGAKFAVLWDGYAHHRFAILGDYKGDRTLKEETDPVEAAVRAAYRIQVPVIKKGLELLGIPQLIHEDYEADDLAGAICATTPGQRKRLVTGDSDWLQMVDATTDWFDPREDGKLITLANFHDKTGFATPREYLEGKVMSGDSTDSISGIDGVAMKTAAKFIAEHRSIADFLAKVDAGQYEPKVRKSKTAKTLTPEQQVASPEGRALLVRNMKLMRLTEPPKGIGAGIVRTPGQLDRARFQEFCAYLNFASITKHLDSWLTPFEAQRAPIAA